MSGTELLSSVVDETANLGKIQSSITLIVTIIIGVILLIIAIYFGTQKQNPSVKALIKTATCETYNKTVNDTKEIYYKCLLKLNYTINNIEYINNLSIDSNIVYNPGNYIEIQYDETNPNNISYISINNSTLSSISTLVAIVIIVFSYINYYMTNNSKAYASLHGISTIGNLFSRSR